MARKTGRQASRAYGSDRARLPLPAAIRRSYAIPRDRPRAPRRGGLPRRSRATLDRDPGSGDPGRARRIRHGLGGRRAAVAARRGPAPGILGVRRHDRGGGSRDVTGQGRHVDPLRPAPQPRHHGEGCRDAGRDQRRSVRVRPRRRATRVARPMRSVCPRTTSSGGSRRRPRSSCRSSGAGMRTSKVPSMPPVTWSIDRSDREPAGSRS